MLHGRSLQYVSMEWQACCAGWQGKQDSDAFCSRLCACCWHGVFAMHRSASKAQCAHSRPYRNLWAQIHAHDGRL